MKQTLLRLFVPVLAMVAGAVAVSLSGGCGSKSPAPGPATVRGKVTFNGRPVAGGMVVFTPDAQRGGQGKSVYAETDADGAFELKFDNSEHIPPGWYRVALAGPPIVPDPVASARSPTFPAKLARPDLSGLEREVQAGHNHIFEFAVEAR